MRREKRKVGRAKEISDLPDSIHDTSSGAIPNGDVDDVHAHKEKKKGKEREGEEKRNRTEFQCSPAFGVAIGRAGYMPRCGKNRGEAEKVGQQSILDIEDAAASDRTLVGTQGRKKRRREGGRGRVEKGGEGRASSTLFSSGMPPCPSRTRRCGRRKEEEGEGKKKRKGT